MKLEGMGHLTTDELMLAATMAGGNVEVILACIKDLYKEIDARLDIAEGMALAGEAAKAGELMTDKWLRIEGERIPEEEAA